MEKEVVPIGTRKVIASLVILLALGGMMYALLGGKGEQDASANPTTETSTIALGSAQRAESETQSGESVIGMAPKTARSPTPLDRYVQSANLLELVEQLRGAADAGDADAIRAIVNAEGECFPYASQSELLDAEHINSSFARPDRAVALSLLKKQIQRCSDLIATGENNKQWLDELGVKAAGLDDLIGQAMQFLDHGAHSVSDPQTVDSLAEIVAISSRIALSKDPEAIAILALSQYGSRDGKRTETYAWMLVACDLGRDCSSDGFEMRRNCLLEKKCVSGNYRELLRRKILPPDQFDMAQARELEILQAIRRGDVSHLFH